jgi:hypothetical protein
VNILTVVWKYLILTVLLGSLVACGSRPYQSSSVQNSVVGPYEPSTSIAHVAYNFYKDFNYMLNEEQKQKQTHAVHMALESQYGTMFKWYQGDAMGFVKAVHGYPQGSGFCRVIYTTLVVKDRQRNFKDTACKEAGHDGWRFVQK